MSAQANTTRWDRYAIQAEIKRRYGTMTALAEHCGCSVADLSMALRTPYPKGEAVIAAAVGVAVQYLWPRRYMPDGRRRRFPNRPAASDASQKQPVIVDGGEA